LTKASAHQGARYPHSQGSTLECLIDKMVNVPKDAVKAEIVKGMSKECRQQVMRIAELQSVSFLNKNNKLTDSVLGRYVKLKISQGGLCRYDQFVNSSFWGLIVRYPQTNRIIHHLCVQHSKLIFSSL
jgi:hypothetical protein